MFYTRRLVPDGHVFGQFGVDVEQIPPGATAMRAFLVYFIFIHFFGRGLLNIKYFVVFEGRFKWFSLRRVNI